MDFADQVCHFFLPIRCLWHNSSNMAPGPLMPFTRICQILPLLVVFHKLLHHFFPLLLIVTPFHFHFHPHHPNLAQHMPLHSPLATRKCLVNWYTSLVWHALCPFTSLLSFIFSLFWVWAYIFLCLTSVTFRSHSRSNMVYITHVCNKLKISPYCSFTSNSQHSCFYTLVTDGCCDTLCFRYQLAMYLCQPKINC